MGYQSADNPGFLKTVERWLSQVDEVLVLIRFSHAAGNKSFEFFSSIGQFRKRISQCAPRTCFVVFRQPQLPHRGIVDDNFVAAALTMVPDGQEYVTVQNV